MSVDNRRTNRYAFRMKAKVQAVGTDTLAEPIETWTRDVSAKGIFLELEEPLAEGTRMQLTLQLPAEVTGKPVLLRCVSRVVRVEGQPDNKVGVGAVIESYEFIRSMDPNATS